MGGRDQPDSLSDVNQTISPRSIFVLRNCSWARFGVTLCSATVLTARKITLDMIVENVGQSLSIRGTD